nr:hypothetical protein CFP56_64272 [Quercus suber]
MPGFGGVLSWVVLFNGNGGILKGCCSVNFIFCFCGCVRVGNQLVVLSTAWPFKVVYQPFLHASKDGCALCLWTSTLLKVENKSKSFLSGFVMGGDRGWRCHTMWTDRWRV